MRNIANNNIQGLFFKYIFIRQWNGAVWSTIANYTVTAFISKESSLKHHNKIKCWKIWVYLNELSKSLLKFKRLLSILFWWQRDKTCSRLEFRGIRTFILSGSPGFNRDFSSKDFFILETFNNRDRTHLSSCSLLFHCVVQGQ